MPIETLLLFLAAFMLCVPGVIFLRNKIFHGKESENIFLSMCEILQQSVTVTSSSKHELKGEYQGHKILISLVPLTSSPDIMNISMYGQFPEQRGFMVGHPEIGGGIVIKNDHITFRLENIYMYKPSHLAEKTLGLLKQMVNKAGEVAGHAA
jgi:hypothetical protein